MEKNKAEFIYSVLEQLYPKTKSFLNYSKDYELLFATILSAQATDASVNKATQILFVRFPSLSDYTNENLPEIFDCVKSLGLGKSKSLHLVQSAKMLLEDYHGIVPQDREELMKLPGVGYKTSGVVLAELYSYPYIPVDTHVQRVSIRLGFVKANSVPEKTELALEKQYKNQKGIELHHRFILFGRNYCKAINPLCSSCPLKDICGYKNKKAVPK